MRELGISIYPFHSKMEDNKKYIILLRMLSKTKNIKKLKLYLK